MKPHLRPVAAAITGSIVTGAEYARVWCHEQGAWRTISCKVVAGHVEAYDHDHACHIVGPLPNGVFHHGEESFLQFVLGDLGRVQGFDHASLQHFVGEVRDNHVQIYDLDGGAFHPYSLS